MTDLTVQLSDDLNAYVAARAGGSGAGAYVSSLIREDRERLSRLLAISAGQLDAGDFADVDANAVLAAGRARRASNVADVTM